MPKATIAPAAAAPSAPSEPQAAAPAPAARENDNLSGAELAAAFQRSREARANASAPAAPQAEPQPPAPETTEPPIPAAEPVPANDDSNAASPPEPPAEADPQPPPPEPEAPAPDEQPVQRRIDKLTAKMRQAERERDEAREQLEELQRTPAAAKPAPASADAFAADPEVKALAAKIQDLRIEDRWLRDNPAGGDITNAKGEVLLSVTAEQARARAEQVADELSDLRAARSLRVRELDRAHQEAVRQSQTVLEKRFAWVKEEGNENAELLRSLEQRVPELNRLPGWRLLAAYGIEALRAEQAKGRPPARPAATPPRVAVPASAAAPRVNGSARKLAEAESAYEASGRATDLKRVLALRREARLAPA